MRRHLAVLALLSLTACGGGGGSEGAAAPAPAASPSVKEDVLAKCREISPSLTAVSEALDRSGSRIITYQEGADMVAAEQVKVDALADTIQDATVAEKMRGLADGIGRLRVELADVGLGGLDAATADFEAAGTELVEACQDAA